MYNLKHVLVLFSMLLFISTPPSGRTGELKNYQCTKCGTLMQSTSRPSTLGCRSGGSHQWNELGPIGNENYQCIKCKLHVESHQRPSTLGCTAGGSHQWNDLGRIGTDTYQCQKCGLTIRSAERPSTLGCNTGSHQWNKLNR